MVKICQDPGGRLNKKDGLTRYGNSHVKDIFNMGIPIPGKDGLYIETGPWMPQVIGCDIDGDPSEWWAGASSLCHILAYWLMLSTLNMTLNKDYSILFLQREIS